MFRLTDILPIAALVATASAQSVDFRLSEREGWVGTPMVMEVEANNVPDADAPTVSASPDFDARVDPTPRRMEWHQSINGRSTSRSTLTWRVELTPKHEGTLQTPIVQLTSNGRTWRSNSDTVKVSSSQSGETLKLELRSQPANPWVGQSIELTLRIMVRPFSSPQHGVTLDEAQMWRLMDDRGCSWGALEPRIRELSQSNRRPVGQEEVIDGKTWLVYEIIAPFTPTTPGPIDLGDLRIGWRYPTGVSVGRDFFGSPELTLSGVRPVTAGTPSTTVIARALPEAGRPASFRGAVGNFEVRASAKPTEVAMGDPITLSVSVVDLSRGGNELKTLQPPTIDQASLGGGFRVPSDPLAGTVDGSVKTFTQTVRPTSIDVKQIPPIEFTYFDPQRGQYAVARTQPIDIRVSPAERLGGDRIERSATATAKPATTTLTEVEGGLLANAAPTSDLLQDQRLRFGAGAVSLLLVPPVLALMALIVRRRSDASLKDRGLSRALGALRNAREAIAGASDAAAVGVALCTYVADRTSHAAGTITRGQAMQLAAQAGADDELKQALDRLLSASERAAFAPDRGGDATNVRRDAAALLQRLDRLAWKRRKVDVLEEAAS